MSDNEMENQTAFDLQPPTPKELPSAPDKKNGKYEVGYARPPQHSRFKRGQSGNPKGKPKGAKNLSTIVNNAIKEKVAVTENGKRKTISKLEVIIKQMSNKAASGDPKAIQQLLPLVQMIESRAEGVAGSMPALAEADGIVMESIARRFRQMESPPVTVTPQAPLPDETIPVIPNQTKEEN